MFCTVFAGNGYVFESLSFFSAGMEFFEDTDNSIITCNQAMANINNDTKTAVKTVNYDDYYYSNE